MVASGLRPPSAPDPLAPDPCPPSTPQVMTHRGALKFEIIPGSTWS